MILAGACIVRTILDKLGHDSLTVSDRGLRHGVFVERFGRGPRPPRLQTPTHVRPALGVVTRSVGRLSTAREPMCDRTSHRIDHCGKMGLVEILRQRFAHGRWPNVQPLLGATPPVSGHERGTGGPEAAGAVVADHGRRGEPRVQS